MLFYFLQPNAIDQWVRDECRCSERAACAMLAIGILINGDSKSWREEQEDRRTKAMKES